MFKTVDIVVNALRESNEIMRFAVIVISFLKTELRSQQNVVSNTLLEHITKTWIVNKTQN